MLPHLSEPMKISQKDRDGIRTSLIEYLGNFSGVTEPDQRNNLVSAFREAKRLLAVECNCSEEQVNGLHAWITRWARESIPKGVSLSVVDVAFLYSRAGFTPKTEVLTQLRNDRFPLVSLDDLRKVVKSFGSHLHENTPIEEADIVQEKTLLRIEETLNVALCPKDGDLTILTAHRPIPSDPDTTSADE